MPPESKLRAALIGSFFFASGFAALLYQVVWLKYLNLLFGNTIYATAAVLSAFFSGLALGSRLAPKLSFLYRSSLRSYGLAEIGVGCFAALFPQLYASLQYPFALIFNWIGPETFLYNVMIFGVAFVALVIPTSLMGATLPLLSHHLIQDDQVAKKAGFLYGLNTAGAVAGILFSAFVLIPNLGLTATIYAGVLINLLAGLVCYLMGRPVSGVTPQPSIRVPGDPLLWLYAISGAIAIAYEVVWTRLLVLHLGSSVYAYAIMLAVFLTGVSAGSYVAGKWWLRNRNPVLFFAGIQAAWAFSIVLQILQFAHLSSTLYTLSKSFASFTAGTQFLTLFAGAFQLLFLPTFLSGTLFPTVVAVLWKKGARIQEATSLAYSYNTVGGIFGSAAAGFLLIPVVGTQISLFVLAAGNFLLASVLMFRTSQAKRVPAVLAVVLAALVYFEHRHVNVLRSAGIFEMQKGEELVHIEEDISATISVEKRATSHFTY